MVGTTTFYDLHIRLCNKCSKLKFFAFSFHIDAHLLKMRYRIIQEKRSFALLGEVDPRVIALVPCSSQASGRRGVLKRSFYLPDIRWVDAQLADLEATILAK